MYTVPAQSIIGRFLSKSAVSPAESLSDARPEGLRIHTTDEEEQRKRQSSLTYDGLPVSSSLPANPTSLSPAAMFLSSFSASPPSLSLPDDEGEVIAGYTLGGIIGHGGFSTIRRAFSTSGGVVAVKIVRRSDLSKQGNLAQAQKRLDHETQIWSSLSHEHILPLFTSVHNSFADFFVTLYCPAGSLFDILKREGSPALPQDDVGMMFRQVVRGLRYLHEDAQIVHRDMKLENVLVDETGICKITDFGLARKIGEVEEENEEEELKEDADGWVDVSHSLGVHRAASVSYHSTQKPAKPRLPIHNSLIRPPGHGPRHRNSTTASMQRNIPKGVFQPGSLPYASPELLFPPSSSDPHVPHPAQDMWALGVMLYTMLSGRLPFVDSFEPRLQMKIMAGVFDMPTGMGRGAERILQGLIDKSVESRWTIVMVDEVAWGVGWGSAGDDSVAATDEELRLEAASSSGASRSHSRPHTTKASGTPTTEEFSLTSREPAHSSSASDAASRRSASRAQRSLSRAPVPVPSSSSPTRSTSRKRPGRDRSSSSRPPPLSPSISSALKSSFLSMTASTSTSSSAESSEPRETDYAVMLSPSPVRPGSDARAGPGHGAELERGRRRKKVSMSRSPSPSEFPATPSDMHASYTRFVSPPSPVEEDEDLGLTRDRDRDRDRGNDSSRSVSRSVPRGRLRFPRAPLVDSLQLQLQMQPLSHSKSATQSLAHTPLESRARTPDVFMEEEEDGEIQGAGGHGSRRWKIQGGSGDDELGLGLVLDHEGDLEDVGYEMVMGMPAPMAMDQEYLTSSLYFGTPPPSGSLTVSDQPQEQAQREEHDDQHLYQSRQQFRPSPGSIVQSKSEEAGNGAGAGFLGIAGDDDALIQHSFASRRGHLASSLERAHHAHSHSHSQSHSQSHSHSHSRQYQHPHPHPHDAHAHSHSHPHHRHPYSKRSGSTPPAPLSAKFGHSYSQSVGDAGKHHDLLSSGVVAALAGPSVSMSAKDASAGGAAAAVLGVGDLAEA